MSESSMITFLGFLAFLAAIFISAIIGDTVMRVFDGFANQTRLENENKSLKAERDRLVARLKRVESPL